MLNGYDKETGTEMITYKCLTGITNLLISNHNLIIHGLRIPGFLMIMATTYQIQKSGINYLIFPS